MKITLHFDTNNPEEALEYEQLMKGKDALGSLWTAQNEIWKEINREDPGRLSEAQIRGLRHGLSLLRQSIQEYGIDLERLYA